MLQINLQKSEVFIYKTKRGKRKEEEGKERGEEIMEEKTPFITAKKKTHEYRFNKKYAKYL